MPSTPDGKIVTGEKMVARVKVYEPDGTLLALIGPEHFDPSARTSTWQVDSKGRILAARSRAPRGEGLHMVVKVGVTRER